MRIVLILIAFVVSIPSLAINPLRIKKIIKDASKIVFKCDENEQDQIELFTEQEALHFSPVTSVYKVSTQSLSEVIHKQFKCRTQEQLLEAFQEFELLLKFSRQMNLVKPHRFYAEKLMDGGFTAHIIMEYGGVSLATLIQEKAHPFFSKFMIKIIAINIAKALAYLHNQGYTHLDIKLENVVFDPKRTQAKVIDLGFCRHESQKLTEIVGSPVYMAPEIFNYRFSAKSDVYSLGTLIFYLMYGTFPAQRFSGEEFTSIFRLYNYMFDSYSKDYPRYLAEVRDELDALGHLVMSMVHPVAENRPSMQEVYQLLLKIL